MRTKIVALAFIGWAAACSSNPPSPHDNQGGTIVGANFPAADLVLGQSNLTDKDRNAGGQSAASVDEPHYAATDGTRLWVTDAVNARVLQWNSAPTSTKQPADVVIGQTSRNTSTPGTTRNLLGPGPGQACSDGTRLYVADGRNNRVLVWNSIPTADGVDADLVLGQPNFTSSARGEGASSMYDPRYLWCDGTRLIVADRANSRVLIWNQRPSTNAQAADVVLGRPSFGIGFPTGFETPPSASSLAHPHGVHFDGTKLYVADGYNNRVLVWNALPTTNGAAADYVIGQPSFTAASVNGGQSRPNAQGLVNPDQVAVVRGALVVTDEGNNRLAIFSPVPTVTSPTVSLVVGQRDLVSSVRTHLVTPTANTFSQIGGFAVIGDKLFVTDWGWNRVLRFALPPL